MQVETFIMQLQQECLVGIQVMHAFHDTGASQHTYLNSQDVLNSRQRTQELMFKCQTEALN